MGLPRSYKTSESNVPRPVLPISTTGGIAIALLLLLKSFSAPAADVPPGTRPCLTNATPAGYGNFLMIKSTVFLQTSDADPLETTDPAPTAFFELTPPADFVISNAVVGGPSGFQAPLTLAATGVSSGSRPFTNEAALNLAVTNGAWNSTFQVGATNSESYVGYFPFTVVDNLPPVPKLGNLTAAQSIAPSSPFTLSWTPWVGSTTNDRISLAIVNAAGETVLTAATDCAGAIGLISGATSVDIPAGSLPGGSTLTGYLTFGASLSSIQDDGALQVIRAIQARTTRFTLRTTGSSGGNEGTLSVPRFTSTNLTFTITGTPNAIYKVQSSTNLSDWIEEQSITLSTSGQAEVTLPLRSDGVPRFYRAITTGGGGPGGEEATLGIARAGATELAITITGTPGSVYSLEFSSNYVAWNAVQEVPIPAGTNSVTVNVTIATGIPFVVYRATTTSGPPTGNQPALAITREAAALRISATGGSPQATYVLQQTGVTLTNWTDTATTFTTDAAGAGSATITPAATNNAAFYRALAR